MFGRGCLIRLKMPCRTGVWYASGRHIKSEARPPGTSSDRSRADRLPISGGFFWSRRFGIPSSGPSAIQTWCIRTWPEGQYLFTRRLVEHKALKEIAQLEPDAVLVREAGQAERKFIDELGRTEPGVRVTLVESLEPKGMGEWADRPAIG